MKATPTLYQPTLFMVIVLYKQLLNNQDPTDEDDARFHSVKALFPIFFRSLSKRDTFQNTGKVCKEEISPRKK